MQESSTSVWDDLLKEAARCSFETTRLVRSLGDSAIGIRAGYILGQDILELLIEVPDNWSSEGVIPEWRGMKYEVLALELPPRKQAQHLRLFLVNPEHKDVFIMVCDDVVDALEGIKESVLRVKKLETCLVRWMFKVNNT